jgi:hypothetical protein
VAPHPCQRRAPPFARLDGRVVDADRIEWRTAAPDAARNTRVVEERLDGGRGFRRTAWLTSEDGSERPLWRDELRRADGR